MGRAHGFGEVLIATRRGKSSSWSEFYEIDSQKSQTGGYDKRVTFAKALHAALFSFQGWENATFVHSSCSVRDYLSLTIAI